MEYRALIDGAVVARIVDAVDHDAAMGPAERPITWLADSYRAMVRELVAGLPDSVRALRSVAPSNDVDPYTTWPEMAFAAADPRRTTPFYVSVAFAGHPYLNAGENWAYRVDHDAAHVKHWYPAFDTGGELALYDATRARFDVGVGEYSDATQDYAGRGGFAYWVENVVQTLYFARRGRFPTFPDGTQWAPTREVYGPDGAAGAWFSLYQRWGR